jgi:endo-1,4-beta-xylanase
VNKIAFTFFLVCFYINSLGQWRQSLSYYANKCDSFNIGASVKGTFFDTGVYDSGDIYNQTIINNYNILVTGNEMKFVSLEPKQGVFDFSKSDMFVDYAQKYNMKVRGHTLCWHTQLPGFINAGLTNGIANGTFTRASLMAILKNHINTVVSRYKGKLHQWDVVNEAIDVTTPSGLRENIWQQIIGNDYIDSAFVWANRADPSAKLYLNDYGVEFNGTTKANAIFNYIQGMRMRNIPITGVGLQCHFTVNTINFTTFDSNLKRYAINGLEAIVTELDIKILDTNYTANANLQLTNQANDYKNLIQVCLNNPNCRTFVTWGFTDAISWIPAQTNYIYGHALVFDESYKPKPAYTAMLNELAIKSGLSSVVETPKNDPLIIQYTNGKMLVRSAIKITRCRLFDLSGRNLYSSINGENQIEISIRNNSVYVLQIQLEDGRMINRKIAF